MSNASNAGSSLLEYEYSMSNFSCPHGLIIILSREELLLAKQDESGQSSTNLFGLGIALSILVTFMSAAGGFFIKHAFNAHQMAQSSDDEKNVSYDCVVHHLPEDAHEDDRTLPDAGATAATSSGTYESLPTAGTAAANSGSTCYKLVWVLGNVLIAFLGPLLDVAALSMAAQSIVVPIAGLTIVWNFLLSACFLHEDWDWFDLAGNFMIVVGVGVLAACGSHDSSGFPLNTLLCLFKNLQFICYFCIFIAGSVAVAILRKHPCASPKLRGVCAAILPGLVGGNQFFIKAFGEMMRDTLAGNGDAWLHAGSYVISLSGAFFAIMQIVLLNVALRDYDAIYVFPLYQSALILVGSASGGAFFMEFSSLSNSQWMGYCVGLATVVVGVLLVSHVHHGLSGKKSSST